MALAIGPVGGQHNGSPTITTIGIDGSAIQILPAYSLGIDQKGLFSKEKFVIFQSGELNAALWHSFQIGVEKVLAEKNIPTKIVYNGTQFEIRCHVQNPADQEDIERFLKDFSQVNSGNSAFPTNTTQSSC